MNVIVSSHRRSGTHLTIDTIKNNLLKDANIVNIDSFIDFKNRTFDREGFVNSLKSSNIIKSHLLPFFENYLEALDDVNYLRNLFLKSKIIYVSRDGRDVMVSLYHYISEFDPNVKNLSFSLFLKTKNTFENFPKHYSKPRFWKFHKNSWNNRHDVLMINYEDLINSYSETLEKLQSYLGISAKAQVDVRLLSMSKFQSILQRIKIKVGINKQNTSVGFRKGKVGEYEKYFTDDDLVYFNEQISLIESTSNK